MVRRALAVSIAAVTVLSLAAIGLTIASASHCGGATIVPAGGYYVVAGRGHDGASGDAHVYQESNGIPGLQRGDHVTTGFGTTDSCTTAFDPDMLIL